VLLTIIAYAVLIAVVLWTVWPTMVAHPGASHRAAAYKTFFLWLISSLPIMISLALSRPEDTNSISKISTLSGSPFSPSEQFVYATTFIAPALFVLVEAFKTLLRGSDEDRVRKFRSTLRHYDRILWPSGVILLLSVLLFVGLKTTFLNFDETNIYILLHDKAIVIYVISILYWYCVNLIEAPADRDPLAEADQRTDKFVAGMAKRLKEKGNG
jgi:hypothetical protein